MDGILSPIRAAIEELRIESLWPRPVGSGKNCESEDLYDCMPILRNSQQKRERSDCVGGFRHGSILGHQAHSRRSLPDHPQNAISSRLKKCQETSQQE